MTFILFVPVVVPGCSALAQRGVEVGGLVNHQAVKKAVFDRGY